MNHRFFSQYIITWACAGSLFVCFGFFFPLFGWVFSFCLFPGKRGTSLGDKRLNMMNKCLVLPIWPERLVSVVKITAMAFWREERFFPSIINGELGKNSSLQWGSSVIWGSHFCHIFPNHFPAVSPVGAVSTKAIFFFQPQASWEQFTLRLMSEMCLRSHT